MTLMRNEAMIKNVKRADRVRQTAMSCWNISGDSVRLENQQTE